VDEGAVQLLNRAEPKPPPLPLPAIDPGRVPYYEMTLGDDGALLDALTTCGIAGLVVGGFGVGHVPARAVERLGELAQRMPVVLASRTGGGRVHAGSYGFPGSEKDLLGRGLIGAGLLSPRKARLLLWAGLGGALDREALADLFCRHGAPCLPPIASTQSRRS
jgi:L-asparaginase